MYKEFTDYYIEEMNNNSDISNLFEELSRTLDAYMDRIDFNNMICILISLCKIVGDSKGFSNKDFRRILKDIIDIK